MDQFYSGLGDHSTPEISNFSENDTFGSPSLKKKAFPRLKSDSDALGLVSILTSDTKPVLQLPSNEYLRLKRLQKTVRVSAQVIQENLQDNHVPHKTAMVTLTYRPDVEWSAKQITGYIKCVMQWAKRRGYSIYYVWVLELTKKGRPHYHVMWWLPRGVTMPKADKIRWWSHGMTKSEWARSPVGYLCKYTSKGIDPKSVGKIPPRARLHGNGGFTAALKLVKAWHCAPAWVKELISLSDKTRKKGRYWVNLRSGMGIASPYVFDWLGRTLRWVGFSDPVDVLCLSAAKKTKPIVPYDVYTLINDFDNLDEFAAIDRAMLHIYQSDLIGAGEDE